MKFHRLMLGIVSVLAAIAGVGMYFRWPLAAKGLLPLLALPVLLAFPAVYWHVLGRKDRRDAASVLPWVGAVGIVLSRIVIAYSLPIFPLRDWALFHADRALGFDVGAIVRWSIAHPIFNHGMGWVYGLVVGFLGIAMLPSAFGVSRVGERFVLSNTLALAASIPIFALFPAIGPWTTCGFAPDPTQAYTEASIIAMRGGADIVAVGIVALPSFHTVWAILSAAVFWKFRWLRWPAAVLAALVAASTLTTGWHYAVDTLAGIGIAFGSLFLSDVLLRG